MIKKIWNSLTDREKRLLGFNHLTWLVRNFKEDENICIKKALEAWKSNLLDLENTYIKIDKILRTIK